MKSSIAAPHTADTAAIFRYQSANFITHTLQLPTSCLRFLLFYRLSALHLTSPPRSSGEQAVMARLANSLQRSRPRECLQRCSSWRWRKWRGGDKGAGGVLPRVWAAAGSKTGADADLTRLKLIYSKIGSVRRNISPTICIAPCTILLPTLPCTIDGNFYITDQWIRF